MFIHRTHNPTALNGTYIFPYVIGTINEGRIWGPADSISLTGNLPEDSLPNLLFSCNHRLGFLGTMIKSRQSLYSRIEAIAIAIDHDINLHVRLNSLETGMMSDREDTRKRLWKEIEFCIQYVFCLEVK